MLVGSSGSSDTTVVMTMIIRMTLLLYNSTEAITASFYGFIPRSVQASKGVR